MKMSGFVKMVSVVLLCFSLSSCAKVSTSNEITDYAAYLEQVPDADLYMPTHEEIGAYKSAFISLRPSRDIFFDTTEAIALVISYDEDAFDTEVANIEAKYVFIDESLDCYRDFEASVGGYYFRVVSDSLPLGTSYPSGDTVIMSYSSLIIGINENESKIAYLYYLDVEIHEMSDLDRFIEDKFALR